MASLPTCQPHADDVFGPAVVGCRSNFDFTLFFEQAVLSLIPSLVLLVLVPPRLLLLRNSSKKTLPSAISIGKVVVALVLVGLELAFLILWATNGSIRTRASVPSAAISFAAALAVLLLSSVEHSRSVGPSTLLSVYLLLSSVLDLAQARTLYLQRDSLPIAAIFFAIIGIRLSLLLLESCSKRPYLKPPYNNLSPESTSGIFNRTVFWWLNPLFVKGFQGLLSFNDLCTTDSKLASEPLSRSMHKAWDTRSRPEGRYSLVFTIVRSLYWPLLLVVPPRLCLVGFNYAQPFLITRVINYVEQPRNAHADREGHGLIGAAILIYLGIAVSNVHYRHLLYRCMTMARGAMVALIFDHTLELQDGLYDESAALTLMSTDVDIISKSIEMWHGVWASLFEVVIGVTLLARELGWVCVMPLIVIGLGAVGSSQITKVIGNRQKVWAGSVQRRIAITSSMLGSMKAVKMMGLTQIMSSIVQGQRVRELNLQKNFRWAILWVNVVGDIPTTFAPVATIVAFALQAKVQGSAPLNTAQAFSSLVIINLLSYPASRLLSTVPHSASAMGSFDRIQTFLLAASREDTRHVSDDPISNNSGDRTSRNEVSAELQSARPLVPSELGSLAARLEEVDVRPSAGSTLALRGITTAIKRGSKTMVVGPVGSGKSTLLKALLGELPCDRGTISVMAPRIAYCAQTPWLLNTGIRDIICGTSEGSVIDEEWYKTVLNACALDQDLLQFPDGDRSIIGSRGLTLSGGQKQRLALARAVYFRADMILLDDVLSELDGKTEEIVVQKLLGPQGLFGKLGATLVLATHAVRHLPLADEIVVLAANGEIAQQGSYAVLRSADGFVGSTLTEPTREPVDDSSGKEIRSTSALVRPPSDEQAQDLTRRIGDTAIYRYYLMSIGWAHALVFLAFIFVYIFALKFPQVIIKWWTDAKGDHMGVFMSTYIVLSVVSVVSNGGVTWSMLMRITPVSAAKLHYTLLRTVMRAPQSFFDETDAGQTLNRFSQDMTLIDSALPSAALVTFSMLVESLAQAALVCTGAMYMATSIPVILGVVYVLQNVYLKTSRQLRYMDLEAKGPMYSHFLETLDGIATIRAFGWQRQFTATNIKRLDISQRPHYLLFCIQRWLSVVLDLMVASMAVLVIALAVTIPGGSSPGLVGIALNNILVFNTTLSYLVTYWTQLETSLGAIARLRSFEAQTVPEDKPSEDVVPPDSWPEHGAIEFRNVDATYKSSSVALRNVSFSINPGEKIGVCGRTGSGKSSLIAALLRLLDLESGTIFIDGLDLQVIPRGLIRERLITIPQDPFMLNGSVRLNVDPSGTVVDDLIIEALTKVHLWPIIETRGGLDADLNTQPLSQGQQQLFCLGRAMLRQGKVLILDEATSSVDTETDKLMQEIIREEFKDRTIITVAHRLNTILDADRILVMDSGQVVEYDAPQALLSRDSAFRALHGR